MDRRNFLQLLGLGISALALGLRLPPPRSQLERDMEALYRACCASPGIEAPDMVMSSRTYSELFTETLDYYQPLLVEQLHREAVLWEWMATR